MYGYVYIYVMHARVYVCNVSMHTDTHAMYVCMYVVYVMYVCMYVCIVRVYVCMYVCM